MPVPKWRCLIVCLVVMLSLLSATSGCVGPKEAVNSSPQPAEEPVTLKFYFAGEKKASTDEVWAKVSEYVKARGLNVNFSINFIPTMEFKEKMLVMAAAGDRWDMNYDANWLSYKQMVSRGSYMALNELLPKYAPNLYEKYKEQGILSAATLGGQIVGLPWTMKMNERPYAGWRSDLAEKAGIHREPGEVKTIEDIDALLHELKAAYPNFTISRVPPLSLYFVRDEWVDLAFHGLGYYVNDPKMTVRAEEQQPFYLESARMSKKWNDARILSLDASIANENGATLWRNGKMLFTVTSHEWAYADPGFADPAYRQQMSLMYPDKQYANRTALANVLAINANSEFPDRVLRFLDMLETDRKLYDLVQYGIEGKTYVLNGEAAEYPAGMDFTTSNYMEWDSRWAFWKPQFLRPTPTYPGNFWEEEAEFASLPMNVNSPLDGLFISDEAIKQEVLQRDQLEAENGKQIEFGKVSDVDSAVKGYVERQKEAGLDRILSETQRQIDEYMANKK